MLCPKDSKQLVQYKKMGFGYNTEDFYETATVLVCPECDSRYIEYYMTAEISKNNVTDIPGRLQALLDYIKKLITSR